MFHNKDGKLFDYCRWNDNRGVVSLLAKHRDLDLTTDDGIYFRLAIKHKNIDMLNTLLEYYEETKLQGDRESIEYKTAKHQLSNILEEAEDRLDISPEIQKIISPYMPHTDEGLILRKVEYELSESGFTLPYFHQHLDIEGFNDATEEDLQKALNDLETLQSRLQHRYSGIEYEQYAALVAEKAQEIKAALDPCADLDDFEDVYDPMAAEDLSQERKELEEFGRDRSSSTTQHENAIKLNASGENLSDHFFEVPFSDGRQNGFESIPNTSEDQDIELLGNITSTTYDL